MTFETVALIPTSKDLLDAEGLDTGDRRNEHVSAVDVYVCMYVCGCMYVCMYVCMCLRIVARIAPSKDLLEAEGLDTGDRRNEDVSAVDMYVCMYVCMCLRIE